MFSYQFHIGDFNRATRHLSRVERSIYRDLIDIYYETEKPLPLDIDRINRIVVAVTNEESTAVEQVLKEFFHKTDSGYAHIRCELEIERYKANSTQKSEAGKRSAAARASKRQQIINGRSTHVEVTLQQNVNVESTNQSTSKPVNQSTSLVTPQAATPKKIVGTRLPKDWKPSVEYAEEFKRIAPDYTRDQYINIAEKFRDHWVAKTGKDATKADWLATWRNWIKREVENAKGRSGTNGKKSYGEQRSELFDAVTDYARATDF